MVYKVFLVEDEIVTREGIRDNVDWAADGFDLCGEAPDGEMALPLLRALRPDVLITDIKMPFMDGLQLTRIVRERMPGIKVVILSGHDEFEYAQEAIKLGVAEYLLKPVTVQDLRAALQKLAVLLDQERKEQETLQHLQDQVDENRSILRERLLLNLVVGAISSSEAIEKSERLGLDLIARCYLVVILKVALGDRSEAFDYDEYKQVQQIVSNLVDNNPDVFLIKKDWEELVLVLKGSTPEYLEEERDMLLEQIQRALKPTRYLLTIGVGAPKPRLTDLYQSFVEALAGIQNLGEAGEARVDEGLAIDRAELLKVNRSAVESYLRCGSKEDFDDFFIAYLQPLGDSALKSYLLKNYLFMDIVLAAARLVAEMGGQIEQVIPELNSIETILANTGTLDQLREQTQKILFGALAFRDGQTTRHYAGMIQQARDYIEQNYADPNLSLSQVAAEVNLSSSHFSAVFSQETGQTFKEHLTEVRLRRAKELLRTTSLRSTEIADVVGYNDPHYFSYVFHKHTGLSPTEFRNLA